MLKHYLQKLSFTSHSCALNPSHHYLRAKVNVACSHRRKVLSGEQLYPSSVKPVSGDTFGVKLGGKVRVLLSADGQRDRMTLYILQCK
jgi:hypothetical protein